MNKIGVVNYKFLNMRAEPSSKSACVGTLCKGNRITIFEMKKSEGRLWARSYPCNGAPKGYWVASEYLDWVEEQKLLPDTTKPIESHAKYEYAKIGNVYVVKTDPLNIDLEIGEKLSLSNAKFKTGINGTFFWYLDTKKTKTYPTSILYCNGKVYQNRANHYPAPQTCLIIYKDGTVDTKRMKDISEISLGNVHMIVSGVGLNSPHYPYNPSTEGFKGAYADVLRKCNKTFIGYCPKENRIWLLESPNATHDSLVKFCKTYGLTHAVSLDGGGSSALRYNGVNKQKTDGRLISNFIIVK